MEHMENMDPGMEPENEFAGESGQQGEDLSSESGEIPENNGDPAGEGGSGDGENSAPQPEEEKPKRKGRRKKDDSDPEPDPEPAPNPEPETGPESESGSDPDVEPGRQEEEETEPEPESFPAFPDEDVFDWEDGADSGEGPDGSVSDETGGEGGILPEPEDGLAEDAGPGDVAPPRRRAGGRSIILDASGRAIADPSDTGQRDLAILAAAQNRREIRTATVEGIDYDGHPKAIFQVGTVKVMILFREMGFNLDPEEVSFREARLLLDSMLGATIDYIVLGINPEERIAGASRRRAMLARQRNVLNARNNNGDFRIGEGTRCMARVVHVSRFMVRLEVFGFETYLRRDSISNLWVTDIQEMVKTGGEYPVEIVRLERDADGRVTSMRVSMKAAEDAPRVELRAGNTYTGHIYNFSDKAYYVRVAGAPADVRCPIKSNYTSERMDLGDYVKFFIPAIYEGVPTGAIHARSLRVVRQAVGGGKIPVLLLEAVRRGAAAYTAYYPLEEAHYHRALPHQGIGRFNTCNLFNGGAENRRKRVFTGGLDVRDGVCCLYSILDVPDAPECPEEEHIRLFAFMNAYAGSLGLQLRPVRLGWYQPEIHRKGGGGGSLAPVDDEK